MLRISTQSHETTFPALAVGDVFKWLCNDEATLIKIDEERALYVDKGQTPLTLPVCRTSPVIDLGRVEWTG